MLGLPKHTEIKNIISKNKLFENAFSRNIHINKQEFNDDIKQITVVNEISKQNELGDVSKFFVVLVSLKKMDFNERSINTLYKIINQKIIFILEYQGICKLAVFHEKMFTSEWKDINEQNIRLNGINFKDIWENLVIQIGQIKVKEGNTLAEQIKSDEKRKQILIEIENLDNKARKEKQPNKKFELALQINVLKKQLEKFNERD